MSLNSWIQGHSPVHIHASPGKLPHPSLQDSQNKSLQYSFSCSLDRSVHILISYGLNVPGSIFGSSKKLFSIMSRPVLQPTQPPVQWVPRALSRLIKQLGHKSDCSPPTCTEATIGRATPPLPNISLQHIA
jgi:hypothetical protein